jgi:site-specific DNA recombinase
VHYAGKPLLFRGLITCDECGCSVTGDIKKGKYVYYSCNNARRICRKKWVGEEFLLEPLLAYFDRIQLPDDVVKEILEHLRKIFAHEQEFFNQAQASLRKELDQVQKRLSRLIDEHLDGNIDTAIYQQKLQEYKKRQREIVQEMEAHVETDETCLITIKVVTDLARLRKFFLSSNLDEKRELLNFVFSNLKLRKKDCL